MSHDDKYRDIIKREMAKLRKPVKLKVFTCKKKQLSGSQIRECMDCNQFMALLKVYEENSNGMLTIEELCIDDNPEFAKSYDISRVPTILFIDEKGREIIRYLAAPQGGEIQPFIQAIFAFAGAPNYYENFITENLDKIHTAEINVLITDYCAYCSTIISICSQFALASKGKIQTNIIDVMVYTDISEQYNISTVPTLIINGEKVLTGNTTAEEVLNDLLINDL